MHICSNIMHKYTFLAVFRPVYVRNVRYVRKLSDLSVFFCLRVHFTTFEIKVDLCAHTDRKSVDLPAEYIPPTFLTRTPSPFSAG